MVTDTLGRKFSGDMVSLFTSYKFILEGLEKSGIEVQLYNSRCQLATLIVQPMLIEKIQSIIKRTSRLVEDREGIEYGVQSKFKIQEDVSLRFGNKLCVQKNLEMKEILEEAHCSGGIKMYKNLREYL